MNEILKGITDNKLKVLFRKIEKCQIDCGTTDKELIELINKYYSNNTNVERLFWLAVDIYRECAIRWNNEE